ncbi:UNVERIFIED_CONTAM: hypothetical protein P3C79_27000, partial [Pseudomonas aeruginosa]
EMRNALTTGYRREGLRETPRFLRCAWKQAHRGSQHALEGKTMNEKALLALRQSLRIIRRENDVHRARIEY